MGFLCSSSSSSSLLCAEDSRSVLGCDGDEGEAPELGRNLDASFGSLGLQSESGDEPVESLLEKEKEQLIETAAGGYLETLSNGGLELSWRIAAIDWICKAQAHHNFGPLCVYLAVNYLDRFLASKQLPNDTPWMQQLLTIACLSLAAKMEETVVPHPIDLQVCHAKYLFEAKTIKRMEVLVLSTLKWRMHSVTPFSYIGYFLDEFHGGKPLPFDLVSRCSELITGTLIATKFLQFRPSEIAAAVALSAAAEAQLVSEFSSALVSSKIPIDKENVWRCHEAMQEMALVKKSAAHDNDDGASLPGVLDASCLTSRKDDNRTPGLSQTNNCSSDNDNNPACTPASKRTRLDSAPTS